MNRRIFVLLIAIILAANLCACGRTSGETSDPSETPSSTLPLEGDLPEGVFRQEEPKPGVYQTISTNGSSYFAVKPDNTLWGWGSNINGQLGIGTKTDLDGPQQTEPVLIMEDVESVSSGTAHTLIVKTDGTLWACGTNYAGQLGTGTISEVGNSLQLTPVYVMDDVVSALAASDHSYAIKSDRSLWAWGGNWAGELGDGTSDNAQPSPEKIMDDVTFISSGECTLAVKTDGTLWAWGPNRTGTMPEDSTVPVKLMDDIAIAHVGSGYSSVIKTDGTLWVWGLYVDADVTSPVYLMDDVAAVSPASGGRFALKNDGTLWKWNEYLQIFYITSMHQAQLWNGTEEPQDQMDGVVAVDGGLMVVKSDGTLLVRGVPVPDMEVKLF